MATLTPLTQFKFVPVFFLMASVTFAGRILVTSCLVTALASCRDVAPRQRETGARMVKFFNLPVFVGVASLTFLARLAFVFVILLVAAVTVRSSLTELGQILVTSGALQYPLGMGVTQAELGFVVFETSCGGLPIPFHMTFFALFTQGADMFVILFMATETVFGRILEHRAFVALFAIGRYMFTQKWEAAFVMVKLGGLFPASFTVTTSAVFPQGLLVFVVLGMARVAILLQFFLVQRAFMTASTTGGDVLATQGIFGIPIMVEGGGLPSFHTMAGFTLLTILAPVALAAVVILLVTSHAFFGRVFVFVELVAIGALHVSVFTFQGKLGGAVIKTCFFPVLFGMTVSTLRTQSTFVRVVLTMASVALYRRITVFLGSIMALLTGQRLVFALEQKVCLGMVKGLFVKAGNFFFAPFVIGVACVTGLRLECPVKTGFVFDIRSHFLVAGGAQC